tara:strand:+ start:5488 stop:6786 length:1299 start_codon:yes stop_codon:yes gene_type:complete
MTDLLSNVNTILQDITYEACKIVDDKNRMFDMYLIENKDEIMNCIYDLIMEYLNLNIPNMFKPTFEDDMINDTIFLLDDIFGNLKKDDSPLKENYIINKYIHSTLKLIYIKYTPVRSFKKTFIRKNPNIDCMESKINKIKNKIQPEQRTTEWYAFRSTLITASSAWKIFDSECCRNNLIYEKCKPFVDPTTQSYTVNTDSPLHWGQKYEPLSIMIYEDKYNTKVEDFGCIKHDNYLCLGASPDGINVDKTSLLYGRMLEIKNIVNREITKIPKKEYWIQMQLQMEVCNLNECDFLETRFIEYESKEDYEKDDNEDTIKGAILYFYENNRPIYEYYIRKTDNCYDTWEENMFNKHKDKLFIRTIYWKLDEFSCILVLRNKKWFTSIIEDIENFWKIIEYEKINGYEHRAPKRKIKQNIEENKITEIIDMRHKI